MRVCDVRAVGVTGSTVARIWRAAIWLLRRAMGVAGVVVLVGATAFALQCLAPGTVWDPSGPGCQLDYAECRRLDDRYNLDWPLLNCVPHLQPLKIDLSTCFIMPAQTQLFAYLVYGYKNDGRIVPGVLFGNLGYDYRCRDCTVQSLLFTARAGQPVWNSPFGYSLRLWLLAGAFALTAGMPLGVHAARSPGAWAGRAAGFVEKFGAWMPGFLLVLLLQLALGSWLGWLPIASADWSAPGTWVLPVLVMGCGPLAAVTRLARGATAGAQALARAARGMGLYEDEVVRVHMVPHARTEVVAGLAPVLAGMIVNSVVLELAFAFPGMGRLYAQALLQRDYSLITGATIAYAVVVALARIGVDLARMRVDPRGRFPPACQNTWTLI